MAVDLGRFPLQRPLNPSRELHQPPEEKYYRYGVLGFMALDLGFALQVHLAYKKLPPRGTLQ